MVNFQGRISRAVVLTTSLALFAMSSVPTTGQQADSQVTLKAVKYSELGDIVRQLKGKVVVVDFWADF